MRFIPNAKVLAIVASLTMAVLFYLPDTRLSLASGPCGEGWVLCTFKEMVCVTQNRVLKKCCTQQVCVDQHRSCPKDACSAGDTALNDDDRGGGGGTTGPSCPNWQTVDPSLKGLVYCDINNNGDHDFPFTDDEVLAMYELEFGPVTGTPPSLDDMFDDFEDDPLDFNLQGYEEPYLLNVVVTADYTGGDQAQPTRPVQYVTTPGWVPPFSSPSPPPTTYTCTTGVNDESCRISDFGLNGEYRISIDLADKNAWQAVNEYTWKLKAENPINRCTPDKLTVCTDPPDCQETHRLNRGIYDACLGGFTGSSASNISFGVGAAQETPPPPPPGGCMESCGLFRPCSGDPLSCQGSLLDKIFGNGVCRNSTCPADTGDADRDCVCDLVPPTPTPTAPVTPTPTAPPVAGAIYIPECECSIDPDKVTDIVDEDDANDDSIDDGNEVATFTGQGINFGKGNLTYYWEVDPYGGGGWDETLPDDYDASCGISNNQSDPDWTQSDTCPATYRYSPVGQSTYREFTCQPHCPYQEVGNPAAITKTEGPFDISLRVEGNYGSAECNL